MIRDSDATVVYVTYQGTPHSRFDRHYYLNHHLPLVMKAWQPYGLDRVAAFFPGNRRSRDHRYLRVPLPQPGRGRRCVQIG